MKKKETPEKKKKEPIYQNKTTLTVYLVLRALVIFVLVRAALRRDFESVFMCGLTLVLMILPSFFSHKLNVELPTTLEVIILLFIFAAEILGELNSFYVRVPNWDTMLHTLNGFLCAAIGFALVDLLNESDRFSFKLSPAYLALAAFCFSMTVGVLWEFFEYTGDRVMGWDMQKDTVVNSIYTVELDETRSNKVVAEGYRGCDYRPFRRFAGSAGAGRLSGYRSDRHDERPDGQFPRRGGFLDHRLFLCQGEGQGRLCRAVYPKGEARKER